MRILFVNNYYDDLGGKEKYLNQLRVKLRKAGHVVGTIHSIATSSSPIESEEIRFCIPGIDNYRNIRATLKRLRECTELFKPDVIHLQHDAANLMAVVWLARHYPTVRSVHDVELLCPTRHFVRKDTHSACGEACGSVCFSANCLHLTSSRSWYQLLRTKTAQWIYSRLTRVNTQSYYLMTHLSRSVPMEHGGRVIPIFREDQAPAHSAAVAGEHSRHFIYAGRLNPWKGPQNAIAAMKQLPPDCHLFIVGSGDMESALRDTVSAQGLTGRVTFTGHQDSRGMQEYYRKGIAVIVPSIIPENCPLVVLEAMMASRAVIASRIGGIPELVQEGVNGYLVAPNDPDALAAAMKRVLRDIPAAKQMGERGRAFVRQPKFDSDWHVETLIQEYKLAAKE